MAVVEVATVPPSFSRTIAEWFISASFFQGSADESFQPLPISSPDPWKSDKNFFKKAKGSFERFVLYFSLQLFRSLAFPASEGVRSPPALSFARRAGK